MHVYKRRPNATFPSNECIAWPLQAEITMTRGVAKEKYNIGDYVIMYDQNNEYKLSFITKTNFDQIFMRGEKIENVRDNSKFTDLRADAGNGGVSLHTNLHERPVSETQRRTSQRTESDQNTTCSIRPSEPEDIRPATTTLFGKTVAIGHDNGDQ